MSQQVFSLVAAVIFVLVALAHIVRMVFGTWFVVYDFPIPMWASADLRRDLLVAAGDQEDIRPGSFP